MPVITSLAIAAPYRVDTVASRRTWCIIACRESIHTVSGIAMPRTGIAGKIADKLNLFMTHIYRSSLHRHKYSYTPASGQRNFSG
jgi:hypothetical protein